MKSAAPFPRFFPPLALPLAPALFAMLFAALIATAPVPALSAPVQVQEKEDDPKALATEGIQRLMRAMEMLLLAIPQFEAPTMNENGDIIIRRKHPGDRKRHDSEPSEKDAGKNKGKAI